MAQILRTFGLSSEIITLVLAKWNRCIPMNTATLKAVATTMKQDADGNYYFTHDSGTYQINNKHEHFVLVHPWHMKWQKCSEFCVKMNPV